MIVTENVKQIGEMRVTEKPKITRFVSNPTILNPEGKRCIIYPCLYNKKIN